MDPTRPSPTPISAAVAGGGEPPYDGGMEHRMTALEARLDVILPTLATQADVASARAETKADIASLRAETKADIASSRAANKADIESLRVEIEKSTSANKADIESLRMASKADFESLRVEIEKSALRTDIKFAELRSDMYRMNAESRSWTLATMITIVATMLVAIFGISQVNKGATLTAPAPQAASPAAPR